MNIELNEVAVQDVSGDVMELAAASVQVGDSAYCALRQASSRFRPIDLLHLSLLISVFVALAGCAGSSGYWDTNSLLGCAGCL